jgi:hypothetical protein
MLPDAPRPRHVPAGAPAARRLLPVISSTGVMTVPASEAAARLGRYDCAAALVSELSFELVREPATDLHALEVDLRPFVGEGGLDVELGGFEIVARGRH